MILIFSSLLFLAQKKFVREGIYIIQRKILNGFAIVFIVCLHSALFAVHPVDARSQAISLQDFLQERYPAHEIANDAGFAYIPHPRIILCSEPSSGNSWCRYALEYLTKRPSTRYFFDYQYDRKSYWSVPQKDREWFRAINPPWGVQFPDMEIDFLKAPILKFHSLRTVCQKAGVQPLIYPSRDKLILIIRNYKELYFRISSANRAPIESCLSNYFMLLETFDCYPEKRKMLVYFEDMLSHPREVFSSLLDFLEDSKEYLDIFMEHIQFHSSRCASLYNIPGHAKSLNKKDFSYTEGEPIGILRALDKEVKTKYTELFEKYLNRYALQSEIEQEGTSESETEIYDCNMFDEGSSDSYRLSYCEEQDLQ